MLLQQCHVFVRHGGKEVLNYSPRRRKKGYNFNLYSFVCSIHISLSRSVHNPLTYPGQCSCSTSGESGIKAAVTAELCGCTEDLERRKWLDSAAGCGERELCVPLARSLSRSVSLHYRHWRMGRSWKVSMRKALGLGPTPPIQAAHCVPITALLSQTRACPRLLTECYLYHLWASSF